jgi:hypothetical protein
MTNFVFSDNVNTTLMSGITSTATSLTLSSATGLPASIPSGSYYVITLNDAATHQFFEIVYVTAISGATLSGLLRGQEGTTALTWATGDFSYHGPTAGQMGNFLQSASGRRLRTSVYTLVSGTLMVSVDGGAPVATTYPTYTPTPGTNSIRARVQGGGGGGAGCPATGAGNAAGGECGNGGSYGEGRHDTGFAGMTITVGVGGAAGVPNVSIGGNGGTSSAGTLLSAPGGPGGSQGSAVSASASGGNGTTSGFPSGANIVSRQGGIGTLSFGFTTGQVAQGGNGGAAGDGGGGAQGISANANGVAAASKGSGASGTMATNTTGTLNGAAGAPGYVIIEEYA